MMNAFRKEFRNKSITIVATEKLLRLLKPRNSTVVIIQSHYNRYRFIRSEHDRYKTSIYFDFRFQCIYEYKYVADG